MTRSLYSPVPIPAQTSHSLISARPITREVQGQRARKLWSTELPCVARLHVRRPELYLERLVPMRAV